MMRALAHQALSLKQPHHCVDLVDGALRRGLEQVDGQTEALLRITHTLTCADLGDQARADEAVAGWAQALTLMEGMTSGRTRKAITSLRSTLSIYQRRKVPGAAELARRAREALA
ncbi:hypothetical protein OK074_4978 [Actinobacteria bacterium OK074]|nr:hypothetical protein OK074_4978 [Actinobacteria bacterium OK074]